VQLSGRLPIYTMFDAFTDQTGPVSAHILLVDDTPQVRDVESLRLRRLGCEVTACRSAEEALAVPQAAFQTVDLVITDYKMPEMNGVELAGTLRDRGYDGPVVLMSGYRTGVTEEEAQRGGIDRVLAKPVSSQELKATVRRHVQGASADARHR